MGRHLSGLRSCILGEVHGVGGGASGCLGRHGRGEKQLRDHGCFEPGCK